HEQSVSVKSMHNLIIQAFFGQLAALSYRRVAARLSDFPIDCALADRIDAADTIEAMAEEVPGLTEAETSYLLCATYAKVLDVLRWRDMAVRRDLLSDAIASYRMFRRNLGRPAEQLRRLIGANIRRFVTQRGGRRAALHMRAQLLFARLALAVRK
ncbi:MAG: hypothetical protein P4L98_02695, partial [Ancalomicrobiaceae bacterium]|nr:hypothetical protein [Ancalomicrobiaceae bacterium]